MWWWEGKNLNLISISVFTVTAAASGRAGEKLTPGDISERGWKGVTIAREEGRTFLFI